MREIQYKTFSWNTHSKNWQRNRPNACQFELTFKCGLHCRHCYTECYNQSAYAKKELKTKEIKFILDKLHQAGIIWLCLTGGDPLTRKDFLDIFAYAKDKGFIITVFTNGYSMSRETASFLKRRPPFVIEMTLNAVSKDLYERISQVKGSLAKVMKGIDLILKNGIALKIKTQITRDNLGEVPRIKKFIQGLGKTFRPGVDLFSRLDGDSAPCSLRISAQDILSLNGKNRRADDGCRIVSEERLPLVRLDPSKGKRAPGAGLFNCAIAGGDGFNIDPSGRMFLCNLIRKPSFSLLKTNIDDAQNKLLSEARGKKFVSRTKCTGCGLRGVCSWCPGKAYLETGDMEAPLEYYCRLASLSAS